MKKILALVLAAVLVLSLGTVAFAAGSDPWNDVKEGDWFYDSVLFVTRKGLVKADGSGAFEPHRGATLGDLALMLVRLTGADAGSPEAAVQTAARWGFWLDAGAEQVLTRQQVVYLLWRYDGALLTEGTLDGFADGDRVDAGMVEAMKWAVAKGLVEGNGDGLLDPAGEASRAVLATIMARFCQEVASGRNYGWTVIEPGAEESDPGSTEPPAASEEPAASVHTDPGCTDPVCTYEPHFGPAEPPAPPAN